MIIRPIHLFLKFYLLRRGILSSYRRVSYCLNMSIRRRPDSIFNSYEGRRFENTCDLAKQAGCLFTLTLFQILAGPLANHLLKLEAVQ